MAVLRIRALISNETESGLDEIEQDAAETSDRIGDRLGNAIAGALAVSIAATLDAAFDRLDELERRARNVQLQTGLLSEDEELLRSNLSGLGFQEEEIKAGILSGRAFDLQYGRDGDAITGAELPLVAAQLQRAGFNTRFLPQLASAFGIEDPDELARQLAGGYSIGVQSGIDFEELFSEIADNPQVYQAAGSIPQAVDFLARQDLIPSETTIQLEQGFLEFPGTPVSADLADIYAGLPGYADRLEGLEADFVGGLGLDIVSSIPGVSQIPRVAYDGTTPRPGSQDFNAPRGQVLVDGIPVGQQERFDALESRAQAFTRARSDMSDATSREADLAFQIDTIITRIENRNRNNANLPAGITYDPEKAAAANEADWRRIGILTGELNELLGG